MATSNVESSVATAGERKSQQQNAPNEYFYLFSQIDNTYRPYKTYFTTNIWTHIRTTIVLFLFSIFFFVWIIYNFPLLVPSSQSMDASKLDRLPLCTIQPIQSTLSSLRGLFSLDEARMLGTCVSMATIIGDNDPINISLTLVALLATLTVAVAFTKESDNKAIVRRIAKLSLFIHWFVTCFGGATIWCVFNSHKVLGVVLDIVIIVISGCLMYTSNVINYEYGKQLREWKEKLNYYRKIYKQIIDSGSFAKHRIADKEYSFRVGRLSFFVRIAYERTGRRVRLFSWLKEKSTFLTFYIMFFEFIYYCFGTWHVRIMGLCMKINISIFFAFLFGLFLSYPAAENDVLCKLYEKLRGKKKRFFCFYIIVIVTSIAFSALFVLSLWILSSQSLKYFGVLIIFHSLWLISLFLCHWDWLFMSRRRKLLTRDVNNMDKELKYLDTIKNSEGIGE